MNATNKIIELTRTIGINLLVLAGLLIIVELIFGSWFFNKQNFDNLGILKNISYRADVSDLYDYPLKHINYSRDKYGFRGNSIMNAPEKIDILTIGGSTTDQRFIDDTETWQSVLEQNFKQENKPYNIVNAGVDGQSTFGHIENFKIWFPEIKNLKPKYILFYIGINDFYRIANNNRFGSDVINVENVSGMKYIIQVCKKKSVILNLIRIIIGNIDARKIGAHHHRIDLKNLNYTSKGIINNSEFEEMKLRNLPHFKERIAKLIYYSKNMGAIPIFVTQPTSFFKFKNGELLGASDVITVDGFSWNGVDYYHILTELNAAIKEVNNNKYPIVELTSLPIFNDNDFYDWVHMTPSGAKKVGDEIYKQLKDQLN